MMPTKQVYKTAAYTWIMVVIVVVIIGAAGFFVWSKQKQAAHLATNIDRAALEAECQKNLGDKDFCKFASNWSLDANYQTVMTVSNTDSSYVITFESQDYDRTRVTTSKNGVMSSAFIFIGTDSYIKDIAANAWLKHTTDSVISEELTDDFDFDFSAAGQKEDTTTYERVGKEACDLFSCFKYRISDPADPSTVMDLWFDVADYKLRRIMSSGEDTTTDMIFSYGNVRIDEPSPLKEVPNYEEMSSEDLQAELEAALSQYDSL